MLPNPFRVQFRVDGQPLPKQSYRAKGRGGYTEPRIKAYQEHVAWMAREAMAGMPPYSGRVSVHYKFKRSDKGRCDFENLCKLAGDAMNGIVYLDDSQICEAHVYLERGVEHPEAVIFVEAM